MCRIDSKRRLGNIQRPGDRFFHSFSLRVWQVNTGMTAEKLLSVTSALPSIIRLVRSHRNSCEMFFAVKLKLFELM